MKTEKSNIRFLKHIIMIVGGIALTVLILFLIAFGVQAYRLNWTIADSLTPFIDFGILLGSVLTPLLAFTSIYLLWQTLIIQMKELKLSSSSLQKTSETTQHILEQERKLFELRLLSEHLENSTTKIQSLEDGLEFQGTVNPISGAYSSQHGFKKITQLIEENKMEEAAEVLRQVLSKGGLDYEVRSCLKDTISYGIDAVRYYDCGGNFRHILTIVHSLLKVTKPFYDYEEEYIDLLTPYNLRREVNTLNKLHSKLYKYSASSDDFNSNTLN